MERRAQGLKLREFRMQELKMKLKTGTALLKEMESLKAPTTFGSGWLSGVSALLLADNRFTVSPLPALSQPIDRAGNTGGHRR